MKWKFTLSGFTLIELLVSISIIGILSLLIVQAFFTSLRNNTKTELMKDLKQNGDYAMQIMIRTVQNAESVVSVCPLAPSFTHTLTLRSFDGNITTIDSFPDNGVCRIRSQSTLPVTLYTLTSSNVSMTPLEPADCTTAISFYCEEVQNNVSKVNISFGLVQKGSPVDAVDIASQKFSSSVVVRNRQQ